MTSYIPVTLAPGSRVTAKPPAEPYRGKFADFILLHSGCRHSPKVPATFSASDIGFSSSTAAVGLGGGLIFSGLHCVAWGFSFSNLAEKWLWRISSLTITAYFSIILTYFSVTMLLHLFVRVDLDDMLSLHVPWLYRSFTATGYYIGPGMYIAARIILIALPFVGLRHLPDDAYQTVKWITFLPHI
jgi:hypothetical protein